MLPSDPPRQLPSDTALGRMAPSRRPTPAEGGCRSAGPSAYEATQALGLTICTVLSGAAGLVGQLSSRENLDHGALFRPRRLVRPTDDVHHRILKEPCRRPQPQAPPFRCAGLTSLGFTEAAIAGILGFGRHLAREVNQIVRSHRPTIKACPRRSNRIPVAGMSMARWSMAFLSLGHPLNPSLKGRSQAAGSVLVGASDRYQTRS